ncbi:hypothetical protein ABEB36_002289 [Hypothenemus hampei]|uniref:PH domain-containing protein n=1 Tax=Hypothenemus hampei TaxID=57062 RepID=A0ABD1F574_HYPHA
MFTLCMSRGSPPLKDKSHKNNANKKRQVKEGYLLRYRRGIFCTGWCEEWIVLYDDSTLAWYSDKTLCRLRGFVRISDAPELLAVAEWTRQAPKKPRFPRACHIGQLLAVGCTKRHDVHWLMGQSPAEINDWMTAISNTLPPPPNLPLEDTRVALNQKSLANGYATTKPVANGCATIIPNGNCPTTLLSQLPKTTISGSSRNSSLVQDNYRLAKGKKSVGQFDNDHTVVAGVVLDWGHGWGWASQTQAAMTPQISFTTAEALSSTLYFHSAEDYSMVACDDVDWSSFGDFCF